MLLEWRRAERASTVHRAIDRPRLAPLVLHGHLDARADSRAVGLHSLELHADPVIAMAGIFVETEHVAVARDGAAGHGQDIFVSIVIYVHERYAVSLVYLAGPGRSGDVHEALALLVVE